MHQEQFKFKPQINNMSKAYRRPPCQKTEDFLLNAGRLAKEKIDMLRSEKMYSEQAECNFRPKISKYSERIMSDRCKDAYGNKLNKFDGLYEDAMRK